MARASAIAMPGTPNAHWWPYQASSLGMKNWPPIEPTLIEK